MLHCVVDNDGGASVVFRAPREVRQFGSWILSQKNILAALLVKANLI